MSSSIASASFARPVPATAVVAAAILFAAGCGGPQFYPVHGQLVWDDGSPVTQLGGGLVSFSSQKLNVSANGAVQADGTFRLNCLKLDDGLPPGTYNVSVSPPERVFSEFADAATIKAARDAGKMIPAKYGNVSSSGLTVTVEPKTNDVTIKLEKNKN